MKLVFTSAKLVFRLDKMTFSLFYRKKNLLQNPLSYLLTTFYTATSLTSFKILKNSILIKSPRMKPIFFVYRRPAALPAAPPVGSREDAV